ncbi:hypothetical protein SAMN04488009_0911 [Maribacter sedimenticola]|uniref:Glycine dehydrogenase n=1 Tax=Maribacter sedimenticola TaxID=228956 RepID=A0ABY1SDU2_9FLAO|nr:MULTISPECIES: hypothetical protein [Maribacter]TVZ16796.1 hypothetical protein JM81_3067 [Maribacter sp. MAR_2009_72]SNR29284.1 hypothetical protein SAMN04488009_0911 [Maribacter sedimenticola]
MMISCEKAACICNKAQYKEASFWETISLRFHILMCKACTKHSKQNKKLTTLCNKANLVALSEEDKRKMKESLPTKN